MLWFERISDERIKDAMDRGEFDNLPGKGKPLDLNGYFATPEHLRLTYSILKNSGMVREEVELLRELGSLKEQLAHCRNEHERRRLGGLVREVQLKLDLRLEWLKKRR